MDRDAQLDRRHQRADFLVRLALLERPQRRAEAVIAGARKVVEREARSVAQELGENVGERGLPRLVAPDDDCGRGLAAQLYLAQPPEISHLNALNMHEPPPSSSTFTYCTPFRSPPNCPAPPPLPPLHPLTCPPHHT